MPASADQPCRCLWRGLVQITYTLPWRRTILQFSQIRLTLDRTFMMFQSLCSTPGSHEPNVSMIAENDIIKAQTELTNILSVPPFRKTGDHPFSRLADWPNGLGLSGAFMLCWLPLAEPTTCQVPEDGRNSP